MVKKTRRRMRGGGETLEEALAAVQRNGLAIKDVGVFRKEQDVRIAAVKQNADALQFIPFIDSDDDVDDPTAVDKYIKICLAAVEKHGLALEFVYPYIVSNRPEISMAAVKQTCLALAFVDPSKWSIDEYAQVQLNGVVVTDMKKQMTGYTFTERAKKALRTIATRDPKVLRWVPETVRTDVCTSLPPSESKTKICPGPRGPKPRRPPIPITVLPGERSAISFDDIVDGSILSSFNGEQEAIDHPTIPGMKIPKTSVFVLASEYDELLRDGKGKGISGNAIDPSTRKDFLVTIDERAYVGTKSQGGRRRNTRRKLQRNARTSRTRRGRHA